MYNNTVATTRTFERNIILLFFVRLCFYASFRERRSCIGRRKKEITKAASIRGKKTSSHWNWCASQWVFHSFGWRRASKAGRQAAFERKFCCWLGSVIRLRCWYTVYVLNAHNCTGNCVLSFIFKSRAARSENKNGRMKNERFQAVTLKLGLNFIEIRLKLLFLMSLNPFLD